VLERARTRESFRARVAVALGVLCFMIVWRVSSGAATLRVDPRTMKMTQRFFERFETDDEGAAKAANAVENERRRALSSARVRSLDAALRALPEMGEALDFLADARRVRDKKNPCWTRRDGDVVCLPYFYILGGWQCGGEELGEALGRSSDDVVTVAAPHFWNEHTKPMTSYASLWRSASASGASDIVGDASPGSLATTWSESIRFHRVFNDDVGRCWRRCQQFSNEFDDGAAASEAEENNRRGTALASPRRRCVDGVDGDGASAGCIAEANRNDPFEERGGHGLSLPHLISAVYRGESPRFIVVAMEPGERLRKAFYFYEHYKKRYGASEEGFATYAREMMGNFNRCVAEHPVKGCVNRFETYGASFEHVFYHADALIKSMYAPFLETWLEVFPRESFLVVRAEDLWSQNQTIAVEVIKRIVSHLKIDDEDGAVARRALSARSFDSAPSGEMDARIRDELDAFYAPFNSNLADLVGDAAFLWRDVLHQTGEENEHIRARARAGASRTVSAGVEIDRGAVEIHAARL